MNKYLLQKEQERINTLFLNIQKNLYQKDISNIYQIFYNLIKDNKDSSIEDLLNNYINLLINEMKPLLDQNLTQALQFGIKNEHFEISSYGGNYTLNKKTYETNENTFFSFDSISKIITSIITMEQIRNNKLTLNTTVHNYNQDYQLNETIESILKFTSYIKTSKRIDYLNKEETIALLKECKENLQEKQKYKNYYEYNDIGYMILRQIILNFEIELNNLIEKISPNNLTYHIKKENITGGKINEEYITPDAKGRDILFPGHTGLYGNIKGLLELFYKLVHTEILLTDKEKEILWKQPYTTPIINLKDKIKYMNKVAGIYRVPNGILNPYDKLSAFDMSNHTTYNAKASSGTCGSWVTSDDLKTNNYFGKYTIALLTNPYSFVENKLYQEKINKLNNTTLTVNQKGTIINYSKILNPYKEILTNYAILLELLTEYLNKEEIPKNKTLTKKNIKEIFT